MSQFETSSCRFCAKPIVWANGTLASGAPGRLPLDPRPPVYVARRQGDQVECVRDKEAMVLHHAVCTKYHEAKAGTGADDLEKERLKKDNQLLRDRVVQLTQMLKPRA